MKKRLAVLTSVFVMAAGAMFGSEPGTPEVSFTLAISGHPESSDPAATSFELTPRIAGPTTPAGPGGAGVIEDTSSPFNTAVGGWALASNSTGYYITAIGYQALYSNSSGILNTAIGYQALFSNTEGRNNTAGGYHALYGNDTGEHNSAYGCLALMLNTSGSFNTGIGYQTLVSNTTGTHNTAIGDSAGYNCQAGNFNIYLGSWAYGLPSDTNTIRIGSNYRESDQSGQNQTFIAGIYEMELGEAYRPSVVGVAENGQLGRIPNELLPTKGDQGDPGPAGPPGAGFVSGSLLFLPAESSDPEGFTLIGTTDLVINSPGNSKRIRMTINVWKKD